MTTLACARSALPALAAAFVLAGCTAGTVGAAASSASVAPSASTPLPTPSQRVPSATPSLGGPTTAATTATTPNATASPRPTAAATPGTSPRPGDLTVHVTYSGHAGSAIEVAGFVETLDAGGSCIAEATGAGKTIRVTGEAVPDASTVSCGTLDIPSAGLGAGPWTVRLGYALGGADSWSPTTKVTP